MIDNVMVYDKLFWNKVNRCKREVRVKSDGALREIQEDCL